MGRAFKQREITSANSEMEEYLKHSSNNEEASKCNQELHTHPFMSLERIHPRKIALQGGQRHSEDTICLILL